MIRRTRKEAIEEGFSQGIQQGLTEGASQKAMEAAENFLKMSVGTVEQIAQATGLPMEEILQLKENISVKA